MWDPSVLLSPTLAQSKYLEFRIPLYPAVVDQSVQRTQPALFFRSVFPCRPPRDRCFHDAASAPS